MTAFTNETGVSEIFVIGMLQGFAFGMVFVSLNTVAFLTLPDNLRTYGASFQTLIRNVASSFGISVVIAQLTEGSRLRYAELSRLRQSVQRRAEDAGRREHHRHGDRQRPRDDRPDAEHAGADHRLLPRLPDDDDLHRCARSR